MYRPMRPILMFNMALFAVNERHQRDLQPHSSHEFVCFKREPYLVCIAHCLKSKFHDTKTFSTKPRIFTRKTPAIASP